MCTLILSIEHEFVFWRLLWEKTHLALYWQGSPALFYSCSRELRGCVRKLPSLRHSNDAIDFVGAVPNGVHGLVAYSCLHREIRVVKGQRNLFQTLSWAGLSSNRKMRANVTHVICACHCSARWTFVLIEMEMLSWEEGPHYVASLCEHCIIVRSPFINWVWSSVQSWSLCAAHFAGTNYKRCLQFHSSDMLEVMWRLGCASINKMTFSLHVYSCVQKARSNSVLDSPVFEQGG